MTDYKKLKHLKIYSVNNVEYVYFRPLGTKFSSPVGTKEFFDEYKKVVNFWKMGQQMKSRRRSRLPVTEFEDKIRYKEAVAKCLSTRLSQAKARAKKGGGEFNLTTSWAETRLEYFDYRCELTGIPFSFEGVGARSRPFTPSLDRIDCSKWYTQDNVRIILSSLNTMILDWGEDIFTEIAKQFLIERTNSRMSGRAHTRK